MKANNVLLLLIVKFLSIFATGIDFISDELERDLSFNSTVTCHVYQVAGLSIDQNKGNEQEELSFICETPHDYTVYDVDLSPDFARENEHIIASGKAILTITHARAVQTDEGNFIQRSSYSSLHISYKVSKSSPPLVQRYNQGGNEFRSFFGERTYLMIRISTEDKENNEVIPSVTQLSTTLFGASSPSVSSQLSACSAQQLTLKPASGHDRIVNGVLDIQLNVAANEASRTQYDGLIYSQVTEILGDHPENLFDFVAGCYPSSFDFGNAFAYATVGGQRAWYQNFVCSNMGTIIHETGHNFGLSHSSKYL